MKTSFLYRSLIAAAFFSFVCAAFAQDKFSVGGGGGAKNGSTYSAMIGELAAICSTEEMPIVEVTSKGGPENLQNLLANKIRSAWIPTDVLLAAKMENASSVARIRTLAPLFPEEFHLVVRGGEKVEGGVRIWGTNKVVGGDKVSFDTIESLKGRPVGAVGGSVRSLEIINDMMRLGVQIERKESTAELLKALDSGALDAVLIVAGAPSAAVKAIPSRFKLLAIRMNSDMSKVYSATRVAYENLNNGKPVDTISTQALWVTRMFEDKNTLASLAKLRKCFYDNVPKLKDKEGTHPKWQDVSFDDRGRFEWYELPKLDGEAKSSAPMKAAPAKK